LSGTGVLKSFEQREALCYAWHEHAVQAF